MLVETVRSCLAQTFSHLEVVITDDSRSDAVRQALDASGVCRDARVRYVRNEIRLGQSGNVNRLFELARGEKVVLLHDDDLLFPEAVAVLEGCWRVHPGLVASYGKYFLTTHAGETLVAVSADLNRRRRRTARYAGLQQSALWAVLARQFPPDAFMVSTAAARATCYRPFEEVGDACDVDFALRLARMPGGFCFVDRYVSKYRLSDISVSTESTTASGQRFRVVRDVQVPPELERVKKQYLKSTLSADLRNYLLLGKRARAWDLTRLPGTSVGKRLSMVGAANLVLLMLPSAAVRVLYALHTRLRRSDIVYRMRQLLTLRRRRGGSKPVRS